MEPKDLDLAALLERILRGESGLYLEVVWRHELMLRGYVASQLYDRAEADDLTQEVFITAWRDLGNFRRGSDFCEADLDLAKHTGAAWVGIVTCQGLPTYAMVREY